MSTPAIRRFPFARQLKPSAPYELTNERDQARIAGTCAAGMVMILRDHRRIDFVCKRSPP